MKKAWQSGYTLMELLTTATIVSILAMVAIPFYTGYSTRAKITEGISLSMTAKTAISSIIQTDNVWPSNNTEANLADPTEFATNYVSSITVSNNPAPGSITVKYNSARLPITNATDTIIFVPSLSSSSVSWDCTLGTLEAKYRPVDCR